MPDTLELDITAVQLPQRQLTMAGDLVLFPKDVAGMSISCLGTTGSGKSTTARRYLEQMIKAQLPFTVADIDDEYYGLKEIGEVLLAGIENHGDVHIDIQITNAKQMYALAKRAYAERRTVVLMLGDFDDGTRRELLAAYCRGLFDAGQDPSMRTPYLLVLEEAHEYVPQVGVMRNDDLFLAVMRLAKRGRKRGLALMIISQRPANVSKDVLTQCQIFFLHNVIFPTDRHTYNQLINVDGWEARMDAWTQKPGTVFFLHGRDQFETRIAMPVTKSPSVTPGSFDLPDPTCFIAVEDTALLQANLNSQNPDDTDDQVKVITGTQWHEINRQIEGLQAEKKELLSRAQSAEAVTGDAELLVSLLKQHADHSPRRHAFEIPLGMIERIVEMEKRKVNPPVVQ